MRTLFLAAIAATLLAAPVYAAKAKGGDAVVASDAPSIKTCSAKWRGFSDAQKDEYKAKAEGKVGKTGRKLSGYNVFTSECMKH